MERTNDVRERAYQFSLEVIKSLKGLPNDRATWVISDQILRSAMSVGANVHEARGSGTRLEFKRFFEIALKSARETEYWLRILKDAGYLESVKVESLRSELDEIISMLVSAIKKLKLSQPLPTSGI